MATTAGLFTASVEALYKPWPTGVFDEFIHEFSQNVMYPQDHIDGIKRAGESESLLRDIENLLYGSATEPGIWRELPKRLSAMLQVSIDTHDYIDIAAFAAATNVIESSKDAALKTMAVAEIREIKIDETGNQVSDSFVDDFMNTPSATRSISVDTVLELLQSQWQQVSHLIELASPLTKVAALDKASGLTAETNIQYVVSKLDELIATQLFVDWRNAFSKLSDLHDDCQRIRSTLEDNYEERRMSSRGDFKKKGNNALADSHCKTLRDAWLGSGHKECTDLNEQRHHLAVDIQLSRNAMSCEDHTPSRCREILDRVQKATVRGYEVDFPGSKSIDDEFGHVHFFPSSRRIEAVDLYRKIAQQTAIAKALPSAYQDEETVTVLFGACQRLDDRFTKTLDNAVSILTALKVLQQAVSIDLQENSEKLLTAIADLYDSMSFGDADEVYLNYTSWLKHSKQVEAHMSIVKSIQYNAPKPARRAMTGDVSMHGNDPGVGSRINIDPANIIWGISRFDVNPGANFRLKCEMRDGNEPVIETWSNTEVVDARMSWIELPTDPTIQHGNVTTAGQDMCHDRPAWIGSEFFWDNTVEFKHVYDQPPKVACWLTKIDIDKCDNFRIDVYAIDVQRDKCTIRVKTWGETKIHMINAGWIAHPEAHEQVWSTTQSFRKRGIFGGGPAPYLECNAGKVVDFPPSIQNKKEAPNAIGFAKCFDNDKTKYHRFDTSPTKIAKRKMTTRGTSWSDTDMFIGSGVYIVVGME